MDIISHHRYSNKVTKCALFLSLLLVSATQAITIIAHRGGTQVKPENTMGAFEHAASVGADYFELDVRTTADDSIIVIHDGTVDRTTNGTGAVNSLTFAYIRTLDAGQGEVIPTLSEVLLFAKNKIKICLEVKAASIAAVLAKVRETNMQDEVILFDFSYANLTEAQGLDPGIPACYLVSNMNNQAVDDLVTINGEVLGAGGGVNSTTLAYAHDNNVKVWRWTVNDRATMESLIDLGVDGIITDDPELLQEVAGVQDTMPTNTKMIRFREFDSKGLFPNSTFSSGHIYIPQLFQEKGMIDLYLHNLNGNILKTWNLNLAENQNSINWDRIDDQGTRVLAGMYLLRFENGRQSESKIIILKHSD